MKETLESSIGKGQDKKQTTQNEAQLEFSFRDEMERINSVQEERETEGERNQFIENRAKFVQRLVNSGFSNESLANIEFAYDIGKESHRTLRRDDGTRYFEHLRASALILLDECQLKDEKSIIAALLHDSIEDSAIFGKRTYAYSKWTQVAIFRLSKVFDRETALMVIQLTKPGIDGIEIKSKDEANVMYVNNLNQASPETLLVKMADRLHNLRTLKGLEPKRQEKIIRETKEVLLQIFKRASQKFPSETQYLLNQIQDAIDTLNLNPNSFD